MNDRSLNVGIIVLGVLFVLLLTCLTTTIKPQQSSTYSSTIPTTSYTPSTYLQTSSPYAAGHDATTWSQINARERELMDKTNPTASDLREMLELDARQAVGNGGMSKSDFESWTHKQY